MNETEVFYNGTQFRLTYNYRSSGAKHAPEKSLTICRSTQPDIPGHFNA